MAKHSFERTPRTHAMRLLVLAALALSWGAPRGWADQQTPTNPLPSAKATQTPGHLAASAVPVNPARTSAQRKGKAVTSQSSQLAPGRRDPFKLPEAASARGGGGETLMESAPPGGALPTGKRGLLISHLVLQGVVREQTSNKLIAVVTNETKVARFLYENDSLYNGVVSKITPDAVYFKENVLDSNGRVTTREVVKRLGSTPGEGR
jgi:hypothetical protein